MQKSQQVNNRILIVKKKNIIILILFLLSLVNEVTLITSSVVVAVLLCYQYQERGAIESFLFIQMRSLISSGLGSQYTESASLVKWGIIFSLTFYLLNKKNKNEVKAFVNNSRLVFGFFAIAMILFAIINSSYPLVAIFKILAYVFPFLAILKGMCNTWEIDWRREILIPFGAIIFSGLIFIRSGIGYLRNGHAFQGALNHPNILGVMTALFLGILVYNKKYLKISDYILIIGCFFIIFLTKSRTSLFTALIVILLFLLSKNINRWVRLALIGLIFALVIVAILSETSPLFSSISEFIYKGNSSDILFSRENQFQRNISRFMEHPYIGTGLNVPYVSGMRSFEFSFDLVTENGNIILALLGDLGIIGFCLFVICYSYIYFNGNRGIDIMFFIPFLVCMGEMAFFSTNNFGLILYMCFGIYMQSAFQKRYS